MGGHRTQRARLDDRSRGDFDSAVDEMGAYLVGGAPRDETQIFGTGRLDGPGDPVWIIG